MMTRCLKLLFCFRKPEFVNFNYINVLVKNKPLLFIAWEIKNACSIKLIPLKQRFSIAQNAVIINVPEEQNKIVFKVANFWRKRKIELNMHAVALDETTASWLIHGFSPLNKLETSIPLVSGIRNKIIIRPGSVKQRNVRIQKIARFNINTQPFTYLLNN